MIRSTKINISFAVVLVVVGVLGMTSYINTQRLVQSHEWVIHTHEVIEDLGDVLSLLIDAETGQRGFILTGQDRYLDAYDQAIGRIENRLAALTELTNDDPNQKSALRRLRALIDSRLDVINQTIRLRRQSGMEAAMEVILSDRDKMIMEEIRETIALMQKREQDLLQSRQNASESRARWTMWTIAGGIPLSLLVLAIAAIVLTHGGRPGELAVHPSEAAAGWKSIAARYAFAIAMVILASISRKWLLNLGPLPLFITFYPAVLLVALVSGGGPGIVTTILSGLAVFYYFVPRSGEFTVASPGDIVALAIFTATSLSLCIVAERLRRSRWADAFALAKQQEAEELTRKNEELAQQSEELSQQSEELAQQNEELQSQSEEIQALNIELTGREEVLRKLLDATRLPISEESVLKDICFAGKDIFGPSASAAVICERQGDQLHIRAQAGLSQTPERWPIESTFIELVIKEGRTACLNDTSLRPELKLLQVADAEPFQSTLSSPLHVEGEIIGAVTIYSYRKQEWTKEQFRLVEWLATQSGHILETLRLQDQLRRTAEQNRFLSDLLERSEQPFGVGYPDGKLGYINAAFERLTGYSRKELEAMDWANTLTPPEWRSMERAKLEELHHKGQPVRYEKEYVRKDGTRVPIELLVHLVKDSHGVPMHYYSFLSDITERKQAEEALRRSEARWNAAIEHLGEGVIIATPEGQVIYWNPAARVMHGFTSAKEGIGPLKETPDTFQLWTPDGSRLLSYEEWPMPCIMRGETVRNVELRLRRPDQGWERMVSYSGAMVDTASGERLVYLSVYDLTAQRQAEQALSLSEHFYRQTLESIPGMVFTTRPDGYCDYQSQQWVDFTGVPMSEHLGDGWNKLLHPDDRPRAFAAWRAAVEERMPYDLEYRVRRSDGQYEWFKVRGVPIRDAGGKIIRWFGVAANIDSLKQAEDALQEAKATLEQRVEERTAELTHRAVQLRALAGELTLSEQRERSRLAKLLHDHLQQLLVAAKFRLAILDRGAEDLMKKGIVEVEELIDESIASSRSLTAELSPPILREAGLNAGLEWLARQMADRQGLWVDLELEEIGSLPEDLKILLFESVRELLFNVVKHAKTRSSAVNLRCVDGSLQLTISDQGVGFDPKGMPRVGESGRGFGLFSVRERLELFGGDVDIQSAPGKGSRIFLTVPLPQQAAAQPKPANLIALPEMLITEPGLEHVTGQKTRILLADDHAMVRQGMAIMLNDEADFEVVGGAVDGLDAVELARKLQPDVILMDLSMPKLNGIEVTRIIHNEFPEICIIGLSMFEEAETAQAMRDAGAVHYMTKSGAADALIDAIRKFGVRK
jgi:PAS domain S-box-containing protein